MQDSPKKRQKVTDQRPNTKVMTATEPSSPDPAASGHPAEPAGPTPPTLSAADLALADAIAAVSAAAPRTDPVEPFTLPTEQPTIEFVTPAEQPTLDFEAPAPTDAPAPIEPSAATEPAADDESWRRRRIASQRSAQPSTPGLPISLAGGDPPAALFPETPVPEPVIPPRAPADTGSIATESPSPPADAVSPSDSDPALAAAPSTLASTAPEPPSIVSLAPPGFTVDEIRTAESESLVAMDPDPDPDPNEEPQLAPGPDAPVAGSAIFSAVARQFPRAGDSARFGADAGATVRLSLSLVASVLLLALLAPPLVRLLDDLPLTKGIIAQLDAMRSYPQAYGISWAALVIVALVITAVARSIYSGRAAAEGALDTPVTRLNLALLTMLGVTVAGGILATQHADGTAAAAAATCFFVALCSLVPIGPTPGAVALRHQPARAWALLTVIAFIGLILAPSLPIFVVALLAFTQVRTNWAAVRDGNDEFRSGPVANAERLSGIAIVMLVLIASIIGLRAMTIPGDQIRGEDVTTPRELTAPGVTGPDGP